MSVSLYENMESGWAFPGLENPTPPVWDELDEKYDWVRAMRDVPQDPYYHAEGDVWIHTRMVLCELTEDPAWRELSNPWRSIAFAACLMHDIAKPHYTKIEDGRVSSRGHARGGERVVRRLLWAGIPDPAPLRVREAIAGLVRFHGLPMFTLEREDPRRELYRAVNRVRCDILTMVARADMTGRTCDDKQRLLDTVELFREYCVEHDCLKSPYAFPSDHARYMYNRIPGRDPDYAAFDESKFEVIMMCGLPGSGKDFWIRENAPELPVISLDAVRESMGAKSTGDQGRVVRAAREQARELLRRKQSFVWNATNLTRRLREPLLELFESYGARIRIVYLDANRTTLSTRQRTREKNAARDGSKDRGVPAAVLERMMGMLDLPEPWEATTVNYIDTSDD